MHPVLPAPVRAAVPSARRLRRVARVLLPLLSAAALTAGLTLPQGPAGAATPVSQSSGRFLQGSLLGAPLADLADLAHAGATNTGSARVLENHPLDAAVLNALNVDLGNGIDLLGGNGLLSLGAVGQYASADPDGSSLGASGAVTDSGAVAVGGSGAAPADATLDLTPLLGSGVTQTVGTLQATVGALSATAQQDAGGTQTGDYQIAGLTLQLTSPLVAGLTGQVRSVLAAAQPTVDALPGLIDALGLGPVLSIQSPPTLTDLVDSLGDVSTADGAVRASLSTGQVTVDVGRLLAHEGLDLNHLGADTDLLPYVTTALTRDLVPALTAQLTGPGGVTEKIRSAVTDLQVTAAGIPVTAPALQDLLDTTARTVLTPLTGLAAGLGDTVIAPLTTVLDSVVGLTANVQQTAGGTFTERALRVNVLPGAGALAPLSGATGDPTAAGALVLDLASATVGPNAGPSAAPTVAGLDPDHGPATGGTKVTVTGSGFVPGSTSITIGGTTLGPDQVSVTSPTSLTFTTPAHAAGAVDVTATTGGGTSDPQPFTYDPAAGPAPAVSALSPDHGPTAGGTTVTVTGSGFVPGATSVTIGGATVQASEVTVTSPTTLTFTTPAHAVGPVNVTVRTAAGTSDPQTYTYESGGAAVVPTATGVSPDRGPTAGGTQVTVTGSGFVPGSTSVTIGGTTVREVSVTSPTTLTFSTPPHAAGGVEITVTTGGGTSGPQPFTYDAGTTGPTITSPTDGSTTTDTTPTVTGTGEPGTTVTVSADGSTTGCTARVRADGTWSCTVSPELGEGDHTLVASQGGRNSGEVHLRVDTGGAAGEANGGAGSGSGSGSGSTADTGVAALSLIALGVLLAVCGAALSVFGRRRPVRGAG